MLPSDVAALIGICFIWAINVVLGRIIIADLGTPPLLYAFLRFAVVAVLLHRFLLPLPRPFGRMIVVGTLMGAGHFGLLFLGLQHASPSTTAIVVQFGIPATAVLSVWLLGERMSRQRVVGTAMAFAGVVIVMWTPGALVASSGAGFVLASALSLSLGSILMKGMPKIAPMRLQAWVSVISLAPLALLSGVTEAAPLSHVASGGWALASAVAFSAIVVTIIAHTGYYRLLQLYDANLVAPLTLMMPVMTVGLGIMFTGDQVGLRMLEGSVLALGGVAVILSRPVGMGRSRSVLTLPSRENRRS